MAKTLSITEVLQLAEQHKQAGNNEIAERLYQKVLQAQPGNSTARGALGLHIDTEQQTEVDLYRTKAEKLIALFDAEEDDPAVVLANDMSTQYPLQPHPVLILGAILTRQGQTEEAIRHIERALKIAPNFAEAWVHHGIALIGRTDYRQALESFAEAQKHCSTNKIDLQIKRGIGRAYSGLYRQPEAIEIYKEILSSDPADAVSRVALAVALRRNGDGQQSVIELSKVVAQQPDMALGYLELAESQVTLGEAEKALASIRKSIACSIDDPHAHLLLGRLLSDRGESAGAEQAFKKSLELDPDNTQAQFFLEAMDGQATANMPEQMVETLFDAYAARFETHLVDTLGYRGPEQVIELLDAETGQDKQFFSGMDLGCGTGLAGVLLRDRVDHLSGVDLSAQMLGVAEEKGLYDELINAELVGALEQSGRDYDLVLACDVLVYFAELMPLFAAVANSVMPEGLFAITTELLQESGGYKLRSSGRFAHAEDYVILTARSAGFELVMSSRDELRREGGNWIAGGYYLFRRLG